jgi:hypothetical protein
MAASLSDVRFTPKSGHRLAGLGCPLCAKTGLNALQVMDGLLEQLVSAAGKRQRDSDAERLGGLQVDIHFDLGHLLDR